MTDKASDKTVDSGSQKAAGSSGGLAGLFDDLDSSVDSMWNFGTSTDSKGDGSIDGSLDLFENAGDDAPNAFLGGLTDSLDDKMSPFGSDGRKSPFGLDDKKSPFGGSSTVASLFGGAASSSLFGSSKDDHAEEEKEAEDVPRESATMQVNLSDLQRLVTLADEGSVPEDDGVGMLMAAIAKASSESNRAVTRDDATPAVAEATVAAQNLLAEAAEESSAREPAESAKAADGHKDEGKGRAISFAEAFSMDDDLEIELEDSDEGASGESGDMIDLDATGTETVAASEVSAVEDAKSEARSEAPTEDFAVIEDPGDVHGGGPEPQVVLSERARMGDFLPKGEVVEADNEVRHDEYYPEEMCVAEEDPEAHQNETKRRLVSALVVMLVVAVSAVFVLFVYYLKPDGALNDGPAARSVAPRVGIGTQGVEWHKMAVSKDGSWFAVCSDDRGAVYHNGRQILSFFPSDGCTGLQINAEDARVSYLNRNDVLQTVDYGAGTGFDEGIQGSYAGLKTSVYSFAENVVSYLSIDDANNISLVGGAGSIPLPADILPCNGSDGNNFAYISGDSFHIVRNVQEDVAVSLDDAKLSCPRSEAIRCALDAHEGWTVVCRNGFVQGSGAAVTNRDLYDFTRLSTGADLFSINRHYDGTDIVTPDKWIRIDTEGRLSETALGSRLDHILNFTRQNVDGVDELYGVNAGVIVRVTSDGSVVIPEAPAASLVYSAFVRGGADVLQLWNGGDNLTTFALWNIDRAQFTGSVDVPVAVTAINISPKGGRGFIVEHKADGTDAVRWLGIEGAPVLTEGPALPQGVGVDDAVWSADEDAVILRYSDGRSEVFASDSGALKSRAAFDGKSEVDFYSGEYLWVLTQQEESSPRFRLFRLADGRYGADYPAVEIALENKKVTHVRPIQGSRQVLLWGESGIFAFDPVQTRVSQISDQSIGWLVPNRSGSLVATDLGIITLNAHNTIKATPRLVYPENSSKLVWSGDGSHVVNRETGEYFSIDGASRFSLNAGSDVIRQIGGSTGVHPSDMRFLENRGNVTTISDAVNSHKKLLAILAGNSTGNWCWMNQNGMAQGVGSACTPKSDDPVDALAAFDQKIADSAARLKPSSVNIITDLVQVPFVDKVRLNVQAVPADSQVLFGVSEGDKPAQLESPNTFFDLPFETTLDITDIGFAAVFYKPGYVMRTVPFQARTAEVNIRVQLLSEEYSDIEVRRDPSKTEPVSDDLRIALATFVGSHRAEIAGCIKAKPTSFTVEINESCRIAAAGPSAENACLADAFASFEQPESCSNVIGLGENAFEPFTVFIP